MNYTDRNRGVIQNRARARQIIDFSGLRYRFNITPTDCDGEFDIQGDVFVKYEFKLNGCEMPDGQRKHLEYVINAIKAGHKEAAAFLCVHNVEDTNGDIHAETAIVEKYYYNGKWWDDGTRTVRQCTDDFLKHCGKEVWIAPF